MSLSNFIPGDSKPNRRTTKNVKFSKKLHVRTCREPQKDGCHKDGFFQSRINLVGSSIKNITI